MRLKIKLNSNKCIVNIIRDYRRYFISFFKKIFENSGRYNHFYANKRIKPFTYSVYLGKELKVTNTGFTIKPPIKVLFSTGDYSIFAEVYNSLIDLRKSEEIIKIGDGEFFIEKIDVMKPIKIKKNIHKFKTIGISIMTDPRENAKDFDKWFITPKNDLEKFIEVLNLRTKLKYEILTGQKFDGFIDFEIDDIKEVLVKHYDGYLKGFKGKFWIKGDKEILQFLYDYGLGVRTGQGFGCLEIIE